ncbi:MAG TPA: hypothetical protein VIG88_07950 [Lysobacter sp.]
MRAAGPHHAGQRVAGHAGGDRALARPQRERPGDQHAVEDRRVERDPGEEGRPRVAAGTVGRVGHGDAVGDQHHLREPRGQVVARQAQHDARFGRVAAKLDAQAVRRRPSRPRVDAVAIPPPGHLDRACAAGGRHRRAREQERQDPAHRKA